MALRTRRNCPAKRDRPAKDRVVTNIGTVHANGPDPRKPFSAASPNWCRPPEDGIAILNLDDPWVSKMAELTKAHVFSTARSGSRPVGDNVEGLGLEGIRFRLHYRHETLHVHIPMIGQHSVIRP